MSPLSLVLVVLAIQVGTSASPTSAPFIPPSTTAPPLPRECPQNAKVFTPTRSCFWIVKEKLTWADAERSCVRKGGKLAAIAEEEENEFVYDMTRRANFTGPTFWLGQMSKNPSTRALTWHDGTVAKNVLSLKRLSLPEDPRDFCVTFWSDLSTDNGNWMHWNCTYQGYFGVCKKKYREIDASELRSTISPLDDVVQSSRCCVGTSCSKRCATNERCIPDDLDCMFKDCPGHKGYGWCLPRPR